MNLTYLNELIINVKTKIIIKNIIKEALAKVSIDFREIKLPEIIKRSTFTYKSGKELI
jgi:hypothetical protein